MLNPVSWQTFQLYASDREKLKLQVSSCQEESIKKNISNVKKGFFGITPERMCYGRSRALRMSYVSPQGSEIIRTSTNIYIQYRMLKAEHHSDISETITAPHLHSSMCRQQISQKCQVRNVLHSYTALWMYLAYSLYSTPRHAYGAVWRVQLTPMSDFPQFMLNPQ
jgi:hypothetical protein